MHNFKNPHFVNGRNTIVHLFEWRWNDIADEAENFLSKKGYGGIQISPPNENIIVKYPDRSWYERYQPVSYKLITRSGNEDELAEMIKRCNAVGIRIYADIVINHMAAVGGVGTGGSWCDPSNKHYPAVPYGPNDFHPSFLVNNYQDQYNVRNGELLHLPDLDQSQKYVRQKILQYMNHLIDLGVAGFRIDAAKHMHPDDLNEIYSGLKDLNTDYGFAPNSKPFIYQEVIDLGGEAISKHEYTKFACVLDFKYGYELSQIFLGRKCLAKLENWGPNWELVAGYDAVAFIDNHDNQRNDPENILSHKNGKRYKMAIAFMLAHPYGTTRIISSYFFHDIFVGPPPNSPEFNHDGICTNGWVCEHRWEEISNMVGFRNAVEGTKLENWWSNGDKQIAFSRGNKGFIAFTLAGDLHKHFYTGLPPGKYVDVISNKFIVVEDSGSALISLPQNDSHGVVAIHVNAKIK